MLRASRPPGERAQPCDRLLRLALRLALQGPGGGRSSRARRTDAPRDASRNVEWLLAEIDRAFALAPVFAGAPAAAAAWPLARAASRPLPRVRADKGSIEAQLAAAPPWLAQHALAVAVDPLPARARADAATLVGEPGAAGAGGTLRLATAGAGSVAYVLSGAIVQRIVGACAVLARGANGVWRRVDGGGAYAVSAGEAVVEVNKRAVALLYVRGEPVAPARAATGGPVDVVAPPLLRTGADVVDAHGAHVARWGVNTAPPLVVVLDALRDGDASGATTCDALVRAELAALVAAGERAEGAWVVRDGDALCAEAGAAAGAANGGTGPPSRDGQGAHPLGPKLAIALRGGDDRQVAALLVALPPRPPGGAAARPLLVVQRGTAGRSRGTEAYEQAREQLGLGWAQPLVAHVADERMSAQAFALVVTLLARAVRYDGLGDELARCADAAGVADCASRRIASPSDARVGGGVVRAAAALAAWRWRHDVPLAAHASARAAAATMHSGAGARGGAGGGAGAGAGAGAVGVAGVGTGADGAAAMAGEAVNDAAVAVAGAAGTAGAGASGLATPTGLPRTASTHDAAAAPAASAPAGAPAGAPADALPGHTVFVDAHPSDTHPLVVNGKDRAAMEDLCSRLASPVVEVMLPIVRGNTDEPARFKHITGSDVHNIITDRRVISRNITEMSKLNLPLAKVMTWYMAAGIRNQRKACCALAAELERRLVGGARVTIVEDCVRYAPRDDEELGGFVAGSMDALLFVETPRGAALSEPVEVKNVSFCGTAEEAMRTATAREARPNAQRTTPVERALRALLDALHACGAGAALERMLLGGGGGGGGGDGGGGGGGGGQSPPSADGAQLVGAATWPLVELHGGVGALSGKHAVSAAVSRQLTALGLRGPPPFVVVHAAHASTPLRDLPERLELSVVAANGANATGVAYVRCAAVLRDPNPEQARLVGCAAVASRARAWARIAGENVRVCTEQAIFTAFKMHPRRVARKLLRKLLRAAVDADEAAKPRGGRAPTAERDTAVEGLFAKLWVGDAGGAVEQLPNGLKQFADWLVLPVDYASNDDPAVRHTTNYFLTPDRVEMGVALVARLGMLYTHITGEPPPHALCPRRSAMQQRYTALTVLDLYLLLDKEDKGFVDDLARQLPTADGGPHPCARVSTSDPRIKDAILGRFFDLDVPALRWSGAERPDDPVTKEQRRGRGAPGGGASGASSPTRGATPTAKRLRWASAAAASGAAPGRPAAATRRGGSASPSTRAAPPGPKRARPSRSSAHDAAAAARTRAGTPTDEAAQLGRSAAAARPMPAQRAASSAAAVGGPPRCRSTHS
ncbi:hypothetical protein KFE25_001264 [Diacronema lutheri]|uniref:Uncharacterized protein n=1 Tax=Diacronema lutheri TaxID=2081491 RepID=A0A8J6C868_DIALT|nr:hypothetical protein KFE25_001264 [Diacronema lutheri]